MISFPAGIAVVGVVLTTALSGMNLSVLFNPQSLMLVLGGTLGVFALSTPLADMRVVVKSVFRLWLPERSSGGVYQNLLELGRRKDAKIVNPHPLVGYAQQLWQQGLDPEVFTFLLQQRLDELTAAGERGIAALRNLAKYPPALGMTGTVIGLVSLFSNLNPENRGSLGPSLALAMTATFYGLVLANMFLLPLADRIFVIHLGRRKRNEYVYRALMLIHRGEPESLLEEEFHANAA